MSKVPERIYLQWYEDDDGTLESLNETTWCVDKINSDDVEYVLAEQLAPADGKSPCGHDERFCDWEDHGKPIVCLKCEIARLTRRLAAAEGLLREACEHPGFPSAEWYVAARAAGGEG